MLFRSEDIAPDYPNLKELIENMFETMDHAEGVGLAAPQIGLPILLKINTTTPRPLACLPASPHHATPGPSPARPAAAARARVACPCQFLDFSS